VAYVGPTKIHGLLTGQAYINIGEPIDINELPKDLKRNERIDYITKEIETRTAKLQQELHEIVKSL
ncbi:TPA: 1-acyl-sn-glycerol-3-phosphate acyltransferase, partial [Staphylococcus aureus]|nr:1-acyl-sn-glycerol-3-phosphate acyltransferase [Staphylococcus aureus]